MKMYKVMNKTEEEIRELAKNCGGENADVIWEGKI